MTRSTLDMVLEPQNLSILFQPIVRLENGAFRNYAFEALTRGPRGTNMERAAVLFEYARRKNCEFLLDSVCLGRIFTEAKHLPRGVHISINVHTSTLSRGDNFAEELYRLAVTNDWPMERIIVEVIEHGQPWSTSNLRDELAALRSWGVRIALDDVGIGESNIKMLVDCRPEILKIDRYFCHGCADDLYRKTVIDALVHLAKNAGSEVLAEGVERAEDLETIRALDVRLYQGYMFSRPREARTFQGPAEPLSIRSQQELSGPRAASSND